MSDRLAKLPPHNLEAEQALLGAILSNNHAFRKVEDFLQADDFADPRHGRIYGALQKIIGGGGRVDAVLLKEHFEATGELEEIGGPAYLAKLAATVVSIVNAEDYGRVVFDRGMRRELLLAAEALELEARSVTLDGTAENVLAAHLSNMLELQRRGSSRPSVTIGEAAAQSIAATEKAVKGERRAVMSGLTKLDKLLGGFDPGQFVIFAGRPGAGKSAAVGNIAINVALAGFNVYVASLEMSNVEMGQRALARFAGVSQTRQRTGNISGEQMVRLVEAKQALEGLPLYLNDGVGKLVTQVEAEARQRNADLVIVDHLGILGGVAPGVRLKPGYEFISAISNELKRMAKRLDVPVIGVAQLSRDVERREDKRPVLADLRMSGELEQDADVVVFIYRDAYYLAKAPPEEKQGEAWRAAWEQCKHKMDAIVAKQRGGAEGTVELYFNAVSQLVADEDPAVAVSDPQESMF